MIERSKRFMWYRGALFFNWRIDYHKYWNDHYKAEWHGEDVDFVRIGFTPKWWAVEDWYYDGHTFKGIVLLGLAVGYGYSYQCEPLEAGSST